MTTTNTTNLTPVEAGKLAVEQAEERLAELERQQHRLSAEAGKFVSAGQPADPAGRELYRQRLQELHDQAAQLKAETDFARADVQRCKERRDAAIRELDNAQRSVISLRTQAGEAERQRVRHQAEADSYQRTRDQALSDLVAAEAHLARLQPAPAPAPTAPEPVARPEPVELAAPAYPPPVRELSGFGPVRYFAADGTEVQRDGSPLPTKAEQLAAK